MIIERAKISGNGVRINDGRQWLAYTHPDVIEYIEDGGTVEDEFTQEELDEQTAADREARLQATDKDMVRIVEDIYSLLETTNQAFADNIPQSVKDKVANRRALRALL